MRTSDCAAIASRFGRARDPRDDDETRRLAEHLAACAQCRAIAGVTRLVERATRAGGDLWPRLAARLARDDRVELRLPPVTWGAAAALAAVVGTLVLVPDRLRFLAACGLL